MLMTDKDIQEAVSTGELEIEPFSASALQGTTYDAAIGREFFIPDGPQGIFGETASTIPLKAGQFALFMTKERFKLPPDIAGHIGPKASVARTGGMLLHGTEIDPGFKGHLRFGFYNASPQQMIIEHGQSICQIEFYRLHEAATKLPEENPDLVAGRIPAADKNLLVKYDCEGLPGLSQKVTEMSRAVGALTERMKDLREDLRREIESVQNEMRTYFWPAFITVMFGTIAILIAIILKG